MKKTYSNPTVDLVTFADEEVITASASEIPSTKDDDQPITLPFVPAS